ncbi:glycosyl transferase family 1 [Paenibacillus sp. CAA11]|uniref:glycosyltransferase n=1 Tax=Paenibacillus sp. CAA11 TaxID=1532905 RepID=UPI000D3957FD|nr:glycosyltransferase [Paenibacillus sp. CAA11]AWB44590.1 glycosyl transferase family 1 [Paenibacillus sp. CAA11]
MNIAYIGTYIPQKCGIATYTHHLRQSICAAKSWKGHDTVYAIKPSSSVQQDPASLIHELDKEDQSAYKKLAQRLNRSEVSVVSLQHEFGIFGGEAGEYIIDFVEHLNKPLAVTFHTVFENPEEPYRRIQQRIAEQSDMILVMNRLAAGYLHRSLHVPQEKIYIVPHGTPEPSKGKRELTRSKMGWEERKVVMSFGLLSRGKGLETVLQALPRVVEQVPEVLYAIVGQTHPEVRKREGEAYREELMRMIHELKLDNHVTMIDRYVEEDELVGLLSACDLYVTPYPGMQQITSGTLAYAVGLGRPVLSTPYAYAKDLLETLPELLIPYEDKMLWSRQMADILANSNKLEQLERKMMQIGSPMHWSKVGELHLKLFSDLTNTHREVLRAN